MLAVHYFKIVDRDLWLISADGVRIIPSSGYSPNFHPNGGDAKGPEEINANEEHNKQDAEDEPVIEP